MVNDAADTGSLKDMIENIDHMQLTVEHQLEDIGDSMAKLVNIPNVVSALSANLQRLMGESSSSNPMHERKRDT
ncbi:unnamed protein product [Cuscuta europaea]|uniref:Uncharacterized protein n=1 Tax=Cuscuta europaea TaxID=41803 RepID=A0A9P0YR36_CUSEU|nr:unnamed protein product [Cuscuta europaea]